MVEDGSCPEMLVGRIISHMGVQMEDVPLSLRWCPIGGINFVFPGSFGRMAVDSHCLLMCSFGCAPVGLNFNGTTDSSIVQLAEELDAFPSGSSSHESLEVASTEIPGTTLEPCKGIKSRRKDGDLQEIKEEGILALEHLLEDMGKPYINLLHSLDKRVKVAA